MSYFEKNLDLYAQDAGDSKKCIKCRLWYYNDMLSCDSVHCFNSICYECYDIDKNYMHVVEKNYFSHHVTNEDEIKFSSIVLCDSCFAGNKVEIYKLRKQTYIEL